MASPHLRFVALAMLPWAAATVAAQNIRSTCNCNL